MRRLHAIRVKDRFGLHVNLNALVVIAEWTVEHELELADKLLLDRLLVSLPFSHLRSFTLSIITQNHS